MVSRTPSFALVPIDGRIDLDRLANLAEVFDRIEPDATYRAAEFVEWCRREALYRRSLAEARTVTLTKADASG